MRNRSAATGVARNFAPPSESEVWSLTCGRMRAKMNERRGTRRPERSGREGDDFLLWEEEHLAPWWRPGFCVDEAISEQCTLGEGTPPRRNVG
jgi:hypothetical protein